MKILFGMMASLLLISVQSAPSDNMTILTENLPPLNYVEDGVLVGPSVEIVREIQRRVGSDAPIEVYPWARAYKMALEEENVVLFSTTYTKDRHDKFNWIGPLAKKRDILVAKKSSGIEIIVSAGDEKVLESHRREVTVVFIDLRGFTSFSDAAEPEEVIGFLRDYHAEMGRLVFQFKGKLEHFAGDGIMVFFNDPFPTEDHTQKAVCMAIEMQARVRELRPGWLKKGYDLHLGVGMAAGYATIGTIGFEGRMDYAAVGKVTILASRLSSEANGGQILTDQKTLSKVEHLVEAEPLKELQLKGFNRPTAIFNILGLRC
jgi:class 3 adenylate cyclase